MDSLKSSLRHGIFRKMYVWGISFILLFSSTLWAQGADDVFAEFQKVFPEIQIQINPQNPSTSAEANFDGEYKTVVVNQGLLDSKRLTSDGLRMIICHEIGHLLGNDPRKHVPFEWDGPVAPDGLSFLSSEGQADYDAGESCFSDVVKGQKHADFIDSQKLTLRLQKMCAESWGKDTEQNQICLRAALGGENFLKVNFDFPISFETPDLSETEELLRDFYPERQCRLDTILAGALKEAERPKCWFK